MAEFAQRQVKNQPDRQATGLARALPQSALPGHLNLVPEMPSNQAMQSLLRRVGYGGPSDQETGTEATTEARSTAPAAEPTAAESATTEEAISEETEAATGTPAAAALSWSPVLRHRWDALWFFCGEHPAGFSTRMTLRASGAANPDRLEWFCREGADKVYAPGGWRGPEIELYSSAGSRRRDDVAVEVQDGPEDTAPSYTGRLTVRKPHRLIQRDIDDHTSCPGWAGCPAGVTAYWTEISYRVVDNVGGTIVGATVNENFPSAKVDDQPNNWEGPAQFATTPYWPNTDGTFVDNWYHYGGNPLPDPGGADHGQAVDHMTHEFYVGSQTPGRGCRVQRHTAQRYRGYADHENVVTPAP
jgi:hypothetical protein